MESQDETYEESALINANLRNKKIKEDPFSKELDDLPFTSDIKVEAFNIYKKMIPAIKRKKNRVYLKFYCIYNAYRNLGKIKDPNILAKIFDIPHGEISKVFKKFSYENTGYKMKSVDISPIDYIKDYYPNTGLRMDEIQGTIDFAKIILDNENCKQILDDEYPQIIAAAIIIYYMTNLYNILPPDNFINSINRTKSMMVKIVEKIGAIYNS
jgi:transcription initiation factor TFIIIB Brf1 subunit/transcription initiation factor TFIIB